MSEEKTYWKWKSTIIDFDSISDELSEHSDYITKKDVVFHYLGTPDKMIHEWFNGGWSSEYNEALRYAKQLGLVENYIDYEEIRFENGELKEENNKYKEVLDKIKEYAIIITNSDYVYSQDKIAYKILELLEEIE